MCLDHACLYVCKSRSREECVNPTGVSGAVVLAPRLLKKAYDFYFPEELIQHISIAIYGSRVIARFLRGVGAL